MATHVPDSNGVKVVPGPSLKPRFVHQVSSEDSWESGQGVTQVNYLPLDDINTAPRVGEDGTIPSEFRFEITCPHCGEEIEVTARQSRLFSGGIDKERYVSHCKKMVLGILVWTGPVTLLVYAGGVAYLTLVGAAELTHRPPAVALSPILVIGAIVALLCAASFLDFWKHDRSPSTTIPWQRRADGDDPFKHTLVAGELTVFISSLSVPAGKHSFHRGRGDGYSGVFPHILNYSVTGSSAD